MKALLIFALLLAGCAAPVDQMAVEQRRNAAQMQERYTAYQEAKQSAVAGYVAENPALPADIRAAILRHRIIIGMSEADVIAVVGDPPASSTRTVNSCGVCDRWFYGHACSVCFVDGRLVSWQEAN